MFCLMVCIFVCLIDFLRVCLFFLLCGALLPIVDTLSGQYAPFLCVCLNC